MIYEKHTVQNQDNVLTLWSSWKTNYLSWKNLNISKEIIKYEDLLKNPQFYFKKILNLISKFKKINVDENLIKESIEKCNFQRLKENEKKYGFPEKFGEEKFFRKGRSDEWQELLSRDLIKKIEKAFESEMKELNYL